MIKKVNALIAVITLSKHQIGLGTLKEIQEELTEEAALREQVEAQTAAMTWQDRVKVELSNLTFNVDKLQEALDDKTVPETARLDLIDQLDIMKQYQAILEKRLL